MDREYIIAGFRIRLEQVDRLFVRPGSHMARAFEPFAAEADPAASLTMRLIPDCTINKELTGGEPNRELDVFPFDDAEADCHFERTPRGYLFRMVPRNGDRPTLFFKAFNSPDVQSDLLADGREPHQSLMRFGLWIMFGIAISPEAIAIHSSTIECEGRAVLFLGESGTGKSTHTRLWQEHIPGARLLNDDSPIIRMYQGQATAFGSPWSGQDPLLPQHFAADCRNRPVEPGPGQRNHPTVNLAGRRIAAPVLPPGIRLRQRFAGQNLPYAVGHSHPSPCVAPGLPAG